MTLILIILTVWFAVSVVSGLLIGAMIHEMSR